MNSGTIVAMINGEDLGTRIIEAWNRNPNLAFVASETGYTKKRIRSAVIRAGRSAELERQKNAKKAKTILSLWKNGEGLSTRQIANILQCDTITVKRVIHRAGLGETLKRRVKVQPKISVEKKKEEERRREKPRKSLGKPESWAKTLQIIKGLMQGICHADLKRSFNTSRETISKNCARAKKAGFALESNATIRKQEHNTFYQAVFMLYEKGDVEEIAKVLDVKVSGLTKLDTLVQEILLS